MRKVIDLQMKFGEVSIPDIQFDLRSRDEIPKLLRGLQQIYCNIELRKQVFDVLQKIIPDDINTNKGRVGMDLWKIFVLGVVKLGCGCNYDKLLEIANNHKTLRQMLGHGTMDWNYDYALQTLRDNVSMLTPEVIDKINQIVVRYGHRLLVKKKEQSLNGSCDSFVVETDVHYPTDINLLFDALRRMIVLIMHLCCEMNIIGWRKGWDNIKKVKKAFRHAQQLKSSSSQDSKKKAKQEELIIKAHQAYIDLAESFVEKIKKTIALLYSCDVIVQLKLQKINGYIKHAERQIDQIRRRVVQGETIPHSEKVFSIFEEHTEWISKGKAGVSQELGVKVCILKDQYGFILHHQVMQKQTDDQVAVSMVREAKKKFPELTGCSFDKGFHSPYNQKELLSILDRVILPKKGKLTLQDKKVEQSEEFIQARHKHSAVESTINALESNGLDRCLDHGIEGLKRYVALAVLARNIHTVGNILQQKKVKHQNRQNKQRCVSNEIPYLRAA